jgi:hypothetical protein
MRKIILFCIFIFFSKYGFSIEYVPELRKKIICKSIFEYLVVSEYQNKSKAYELLYGPTGIYELSDAFKIISQIENETIYNNVKRIESYTYYGISIEVHKIPKGISDYYYIAIVGVSGQGLTFDLLLFDRDETFLDKYTFGSKYQNGKKMYEYKELYDNCYGIIINTNTSSSGSYDEYLRLLIINKNKFKEVFVLPLIKNM